MSIPWKRVFRWSFFLFCLTLLGVGIYRFEADEPRWTVEPTETAINVPLRFATDGKSVYLLPFGPPPSTVNLWIDLVLDDKPPRRLRVWDIASGKAGASYPATGSLTGTSVFSKDGRYFAAICDYKDIPSTGEERFVCLVDLQSGNEKQLQTPCALHEANLDFSPCGRYLVVGRENELSPLQIYESATGNLLEERWCNGLVAGVTFTADYLLYADRDEADRPEIVLWGLDERKIVATLMKTKALGVASADGQYLLTGGEKEGSWVAWNLHTRRIEATWNAGERHRYSAQFLATSDRCCAFFFSTMKDKGFTEVWDIKSGKQVGQQENEFWNARIVIEPRRRQIATYGSLPENRIVRPRYPSPVNLRVLEMPSLKEAWQMSNVCAKSFDFTMDGERIIVAPADGNEIQIRDTATGVVKQTISTHPSINDTAHLSMTPDGKHLCIFHGSRQNGLWAYAGTPPAFWRRALQWLHLDPDDPSRPRDLVIVYDLEMNCERLRLRGWNAADAMLSDDGTILITTHEEEGGRLMRCWDVGSTKPLRWPLAIPATFGVVLWGLAQGVGRWRKRRAEARFQPPEVKTA